MVIRKMSDHAISHNWFAVGIDLLIVVIGVFLGIQASNWNAARQEAAEARTVRSRLIQDLDANEAVLAGRQVYYGQVRQYGLQALAGFTSKRTDLGEQFLIDAYQSTQVNLRPVRRYLYDELVAAGKLGSIGDLSVQQEAAEYYLGLQALDDLNERTLPYRDRVRRQMPYPVEERIRALCNDRGRLDRGAIVVTLPTSCHINMDPAVIAQAVAQLRDAPEMNLDLGRYLIDLDQKLSMHKSVERRAHLLKLSLQNQDG